MEAQYRIDVRGKACPLPVISMRGKLKEMKSGEILEIITDFAASRDNIKRTAIKEGHEILDIVEQDGSFRIFIRKRE
ncbi:MAG: sulfurtransferase TusA family protein [Candidatus Jordarchaeaceae archaeon]